MAPETWQAVQEAVETIKAGKAKRVNVTDKVIVYAVATIIRIDIKG